MKHLNPTTLRRLLMVALTLSALHLFNVDEAAYMAWTQGGPDIPDQLLRDLAGVSCLVAVGVLAWVGRR